MADDTVSPDKQEPKVVSFASRRRLPRPVAAPPAPQRPAGACSERESRIAENLVNRPPGPFSGRGG